MEQYLIQRDVKAIKTWGKVDNNGMTNLHLSVCNNQFRPLLKQKVKQVNISFYQATCMSKPAKSIIACEILRLPFYYFLQQGQISKHYMIVHFVWSKMGITQR